MEKKYKQHLVDTLQTNTKTKQIHGMDVIFKLVPDDARENVLDPRVYKSMKFPMLMMKFMPKKKNQSFEEMILGMRPMFNGIKSIHTTRDDTKITRTTFNNNGYDVPIRIYEPACLEEGKQYPVLYYIHGGGFFAGSPDVVEEACKFIAETYPCVVTSVDYRLAPENPYPLGHDDCYEGVKWVAANISNYHGNPDQIFVSGDSAGGNLTAYCSLRDKEDGGKLVKAQILYYPTVNMIGTKDEYFQPAPFDSIRAHSNVVNGMTGMMGGMSGGLADLMGPEADPASKYLSPYSSADLSGQAPALMIVGQYDFLYYESVAYAKKLQLAGVPAKTIVYNGQTHAFLDQMGIQPQAEDSCLEVIKFAKEVFSK